MKRQKVKHFSDDEKRMIIQAHLMSGKQTRLWRPYYSKYSDMSEKIDKFAVANNKDDDLLDRSPT